MAPYFWIGAQVLLDLLMVVLLVWFLRSFSKQQNSREDHEAAIRKAEEILGEMRDLSRVLDANLKEKKDLSNRILTQMDQVLKKAEESYGRLSSILPKMGRIDGPQPDQKDSEKTRSSVFALLAKGLDKEEIGRHLGIGTGEIELMMKLWPPPEKR
ncbi:MAG: hypothetical protein C4576_06555 [Desulfobacteraceae bacterium]|nr:MAG: hypothetical protein C4576_06555 [Desulfobacteraceae bacterium]